MIGKDVRGKIEVREAGHREGFAVEVGARGLLTTPWIPTESSFDEVLDVGLEFLRDELVKLADERGWR